MNKVIDEYLRSRILECLHTGSNYSSNVLPSRLEVLDNRVMVVERRVRNHQALDIYRFDITKTGMLYEVLAMSAAGWIQRGRNRKSGIQYWLTEKGSEHMFRLREKLRAAHIERVLKNAGTRYLLGMLRRTYCCNQDYWEPWPDEIKAELAKRPHVERASERRERVSKKEKGDVRRRQFAKA